MVIACCGESRERSYWSGAVKRWSLQLWRRSDTLLSTSTLDGLEPSSRLGTLEKKVGEVTANGVGRIQSSI